jgi:hypothetical protein
MAEQQPTLARNLPVNADMHAKVVRLIGILLSNRQTNGSARRARKQTMGALCGKSAPGSAEEAKNEEVDQQVYAYCVFAL